MGIHVSEHRLMDTLQHVCSVSEMLVERVKRDGPFNGCLIRSKSRRDIFRLLMEQHGWQTEFGEFPVTPDLKGENIHAQWNNAASPYFLFSCHVDYCAGEGANDNGTGMSVCVELARQLAGTDAARHVRFSGFDMEERGLLGSKARVERKIELPKRVVNIDAIGAGDLFMMSDDDLSTGLISELWKAANETDARITRIDGKRIKISSDHVPFWQKKVAATSILAYGPEVHDTLINGEDASKQYEKLMAASNANTPEDVIAAVDPENMVATVRLLLQWISNHS